MSDTMSTNRKPRPARRSTKALQGVVVPVDNRSSYEHVQDACFEGLMRDYVRNPQMIEMISNLYGMVLADRATDAQARQDQLDQEDPL